MVTRNFLLASVTACAAAFGGCSRIASIAGPSTGGSLDVRSQTSQAFLTLPVTHAAYILPPGEGAGGTEPQSADVYLTDLPLERLRDSSDTLAGLSGSITHVHVFLIPSAGDTPIDPTACNISMRSVVLVSSNANESGAASGSEASVDNRVGVYAGGGFLLPSRAPGASTFSGSLLDASARLVNRSVGFADPLSPARVSGSFAAPQDPETATLLAARMRSLAARANLEPATVTTMDAAR